MGNVHHVIIASQVWAKGILEPVVAQAKTHLKHLHIRIDIVYIPIPTAETDR